MDTRTETDSFGPIEVPAHALWGAQTQRAVQNFPISGRPMPRGFIRALGLMPLPTEKRNEGQTDVAVQIQGVWVRPGDWLYADEDGIVIMDKPKA